MASATFWDESIDQPTTRRSHIEHERALMAIRRDFDVVGIAILAVISALGGGILRDLVLGDTPPPAFAEWEYLVVPLAVAAES